MSCQTNSCQLAAVNTLYEVVILKDEIYHDIDSDTHALQRFRKALDVPLATDENGRYQLDRYIDLAVNQVAKRLTAYIATEHPHATVNNHTFPWEEHTFHLVMPSSWPPETLDGLKDSIHRYIVRSVEAEVLSVALLPTDPIVQQYRQDAADADAEIVKDINRRTVALRVTFAPFG